MAIVIRMPAVLASATEAAIQSWSVTEGQVIAVGDALADIETDKAVVEYAAEVAGTVGKLIAQPGDNLAVGEPIAIVLAIGEGMDAVGPALAAAASRIRRLPLPLLPRFPRRPLLKLLRRRARHQALRRGS